MTESIVNDNDGVYQVLTLGQRGSFSSSGKYSVRLTVEGKKRNLGLFDTEQEANESYQNELGNG